MTLRVWGEQAAPPADAGVSGAGPGARYLAARRRARQVPEVETLRSRLGALVKAERVERHDRPPLLATVQHLRASRRRAPVPGGGGGGGAATGAVAGDGDGTVASLRLRRGGVSERRPPIEVREIESLRAELQRQANAPRWNADPQDVQRSVAQLVLTLVEFLRQLLERQAIRRMERDSLTAEETEDIGLALMRLEETVRELADRFGLQPEDLNLDLGPLGRLL